MAGGSCAWSRRGAARARALRGLLRDTQRACNDVAEILHVEPEIQHTVQEVQQLASRPTMLVLLGRTQRARVRLLHALLGRRLLDEDLAGGCRWIRVQYGANTSVQVHLIIGNSEFELVEELECNKRPWDTLPKEDLLREDESSHSTVLEIEVNNQFLKDGLKILLPPELVSVRDPSLSLNKLKEIYSEAYSKRDNILRGYNQVFLYAIDKIGKNVFSECFCDSSMVPSRSDEDFWSTYNLYYMTRSDVGTKTDLDSNVAKTDAETDVVEAKRDGECVFDSVNCLDFHQIKELNPSAQLLLFLLSDSRGGEEQEAGEAAEMGRGEATESTEDLEGDLPEAERCLQHDTGPGRGSQGCEPASALDQRRLYEDQCAFMNDFLDQWELMSPPTPKYKVKTQWMVLDDRCIMRTVDQKTAGLSNPHEKTKAKEENDKVVKSRTALLNRIVRFASDCLQTYILEYCTKLSEVHVKLLQQFILASFDLARELQIVPKKIQYVATQEHQLYEVISEKFSKGEKRQELLQMISQVLQEMKAEVDHMDWSVDDLPYHQDKRYGALSNQMSESSAMVMEGSGIELKSQAPEETGHESTERSSCCSDSEVEEAESCNSYSFHDYDIIHSDDHSLSNTLYLSTYTSTLATPVPRTRDPSDPSDAVAHWLLSGAPMQCDKKTQMSVKQATLDVQKTVLSKVSRVISERLLGCLDCLKDSYFGTLQRCLSSLERSSRSSESARAANAAVQQLLSACRVTLEPNEDSSGLRWLWQLLQALPSGLGIQRSLGSDCCVLSASWRRAKAHSVVRALSATRLAREVSQQILVRLSTAHEKYQSALATLEAALASRLHHTEDVKLAIRKKYAPNFARLCLESTSMCDLLMYGLPELGREIGRGQYGVVYCVRGSWAGRQAVAAKSVLPADERHYSELAMEFFYTRSIPGHPRIVPLLGSLVSLGAGAPPGAPPGVLLVSARKSRDLHASVRSGMTLGHRMAVALDIVEGIRYLHSLGLVHRDVKMKNVLLDEAGRASLTDLGFCACEALMSGSVVGTPVHMAPELLRGDYDASVDVYAFGILFWYLCAGSVKLPTAFEAFQNKEQLWSKVRKGLRPERLPHFSDLCWEVMSSCWSSEPSQRALLGEVETKLQQVLAQVEEDEPRAPRHKDRRLD